VFAAIGCAPCHRPVLRPAEQQSAVRSKPVALFSDLLLHDVGTGDGIVQGRRGDEIRTPALWGLRLRRPLLPTAPRRPPQTRIRRHAGEAGLARRGFEQLSDADRTALLAFLRSIWVRVSRGGRFSGPWSAA
jgi:CxxC motif-containing protein (DUF1111 family)